MTTVLNAAAIQDITAHALRQLERTPIDPDPFAHIVIENFFPEDFFRQLMAHFPDRSHFRKVTYPGTGHGKRAAHYQDYGLACADIGRHPYYDQVHTLFRSGPFPRALLDKFSRKLADGSTPIPSEKHQYFANGAGDFTSVFDLQIDFPGYELPPHPDVPQKIVTFQFFLVETNELSRYGTLLCKPKNGRPTVTRSLPVEMTGMAVEAFALATGLNRTKAYRELMRSERGLRFGIGTRGWLPWELFDVVKVAPASRNSFMAFAPNARSYHAARMDIPEGITQERRVLRGFIRSGKDTANWIAPAK